jgi:hypothetical protein
MDDYNLGSSIIYNVEAGNISFELKQGVSVEDEEDDENSQWTWTEIVTNSGGDWTKVTGITITYTSDKPIILTLQDNLKFADAGRGYFVELAAGDNVTKTIAMTDFAHLEEDWETLTEFPLGMLYVLEGVAISPASENVKTIGTIKALRVIGLVVAEEWEGETRIISRGGKKSMAALAVIAGGNLKLSLPASTNKADIVLFDLRGRIIFQRNVAVSANSLSIALPKSISRYQVTILQVKTNTGFNMTKRIMIK